MAAVFDPKSISLFFQTPHTQTLFFLAAALGLKDPLTHAHARRVAAYAGRLADRMGLTNQDIVQIIFGGMLHDVGKIALSDRIFSNEKKALSLEMWWEVRSHPRIGSVMLKQINCTGTIHDVVLFHHERMDGSGYPFGLKSDAIPLAARIVSIADSFDAITSNRPYQKRKSCKEAIEVLSDTAGHCLDVELVRLFIDDIRRNGMIQPRRNEPDGRPAWC